MNYFNQHTAMNHQLQLDAAETTIQHVMARKRIAGRAFDAALREYKTSIALDMTLVGAIGMALGVLVCCIF